MNNDEKGIEVALLENENQKVYPHKISIYEISVWKTL